MPYPVLALASVSALAIPNKHEHDRTMIQGTERGTGLTKFGQLDDGGHGHAGQRAQQKAAALNALKSMLPAIEYEAMAAQCQSGEREVPMENDFVLTCFSPK